MTVEEGNKPNELDAWIGSLAGKLVHDTMHGIYMYQHVTSRALEELYGADIAELLPKYGYDAVNAVGLLGLERERVVHAIFQPELLARFIERMPVKDIHNAAYFPDTDRLLSGTPNTYFLSRAWEIGERIQHLPEYLAGDRKYIVGMTATVKENGWKIFDNLGMGYPNSDAKDFAQGLLNQGYLPLGRDKATKRYTRIS